MDRLDLTRLRSNMGGLFTGLSSEMRILPFSGLKAEFSSRAIFLKVSFKTIFKEAHSFNQITFS